MAADFAVLTIVPEAHRAVRVLFGLDVPERRGNETYLTGSVEAAVSGQHFVVLARAVDRSNLPAQEATHRLLAHWQPRQLVVADIGGGFTGRDGLGVGDVVCASYLHYYELVKEIAGVAGPEGRSIAFAHPSRAPRAALAFLAAESGWHRTIPLPRPARDGAAPVLLEGEIISGDRLLADPSSPTIKGLAARYPKALALDMESAGVARAVYGAQQDSIFTQFTVLRGISDLVDATGENNQATRDDWKPYAAHAAAAAALAFVRHTPNSEQAEAQIPATVRTYRTAFQQSLQRRLPDDAVIFPLELRSAPPGEVPQDSPAAVPQPIERDRLLEVLDTHHRVVLYGPSGAGKSWALLHLARQVVAGDDPLAVVIDLKSFRPEWLQQIAASPVGEALMPAIDAILSAAREPITASKLDELAQDRTVLVLVDGLNEVPDVGERMLIALNEYCRQQAEHINILVTDRRAERFYTEAGWKLVHCRGLVGAEAQAIVDEHFGEGTFTELGDADKELLRLPFFLDWALEINDPRLAPRAHAVERFVRCGGMSDDDLQRTATAAYTTYVARRSVFAVRELVELDSNELLGKLHNAGIVVHRGDDQGFAHQLYYQFFAAYFIAPRSDLWTTDTLDAITANAASLDAVGMTLALIADSNGRDALLRVVYDWNWRAAVMALRETQAAGKDVSTALEVAVLALAAEKLFDPVDGTARRVREQLRRFPIDGLAARLRHARNHEALLRLVEELDVSGAPWYADWKQTFLNRPPNGAIDDDEIAKVTSHEAMLGWTAANTIRRFPQDGLRAGQLRALYLAHQRDTANTLADTIRWRIVHALGRWPSRENAGLLKRALDEDNYLWVHYGAVRSLIEMAALAPDDLRNEILAGIRARITTLAPAPLAQIAWSAPYRDAREGWLEVVPALIETVLEAQNSDTDRRRWQRRLERFNQYAQAGGNRRRE
jgi:nucleoside phosphorylase